MKVIIEKIFETKSFGANGFKKREWIGIDNENPQYPQYLKFEFTKDACSKLDEFTEGQEVEVEFNIKGNKYENPKKGTQYFVSLQAWKITATQGSQQQSETPVVSSEPDDLPF